MNRTVRLPSDHPLRRRLAGEVHARPPVPVPLPAVASAIALLRPAGVDDLAPLRALAASAGVAFAEPEHPHLVLELPGLRVKWERHSEKNRSSAWQEWKPGLRVKWERHSEFTSYLFVRAPVAVRLAELEELPSAFAALPADWLASLAGETVAAVDVTLLADEGETLETIARHFAGPTLVGSRIADGAARVFTDFQTSGDGRCRWLVLDQGLSAGQRARVVQRLVEIETYRVMAMLAFPAARELARALGAAEARLAAITARSAELADKPPAEATREERELLDELMRLGAECEESVAASAFRFSAARAYWEIVGQRVAELREARGEGLPTVGEFLARRLAPAMATVAATARRQRELSARVARAGNLMRTRVDLAREEQNQRLLAAMERRGKLSLRLQQTVEGLSVAAITYYAVGLLGVLVRPLERIWPGFAPEWVTAAAVPVLAFAIWRGVRRIRRELIGG